MPELMSKKGKEIPSEWGLQVASVRIDSNGQPTWHLVRGPSRKRGFRLTSARDVAKFLARIANDVYLSRLDPQTGSRLAHICNVLLGALQTSDLESRVEALEKKIGGENEPREKD